MKLFLAILFLMPLIASAEPSMEEDREFSLTTDYFDRDAKKLDYYPFTQDLKTIDEGISGEYSYCWSIGFVGTRHIVEAACLGDTDRVLLGWWRSEDRAARVVALAVFYCTKGDPDMSPFPRFAEDAKRFDQAEARERAEEIMFVMNHVPYFKNWLRSLVSDNLPKDSALLKALGQKQEVQQEVPAVRDKASN